MRYTLRSTALAFSIIVCGFANAADEISDAEALASELGGYSDICVVGREFDLEKGEFRECAILKGECSNKASLRSSSKSVERLAARMKKDEAKRTKYLLCFVSGPQGIPVKKKLMRVESGRIVWIRDRSRPPVKVPIAELRKFLGNGHETGIGVTRKANKRMQSDL